MTDDFERRLGVALKRAAAVDEAPVSDSAVAARAVVEAGTLPRARPRRVVLVAALVVGLVVLAGGVWWAVRPTADRSTPAETVASCRPADLRVATTSDQDPPSFTVTTAGSACRLDPLPDVTAAGRAVAYVGSVDPVVIGEGGGAVEFALVFGRDPACDSSDGPPVEEEIAVDVDGVRTSSFAITAGPPCVFEHLGVVVTR